MMDTELEAELEKLRSEIHELEVDVEHLSTEVKVREAELLQLDADLNESRRALAQPDQGRDERLLSATASRRLRQKMLPTILFLSLASVGMLASSLAKPSVTQMLFCTALLIGGVLFTLYVASRDTL